MKKGLTELVFILDESGSMSGLEEDTIGGFNSMLDRQRREAGEALVSTVLFADGSRVIHDRVSLDGVAPMTRRDYAPGGCTALLDALGGAIRHIGNVHRYARPEDVPEHTVIVVTTDGLENASRRYSRDEVRRMVRRQRDRYGWEFLFLGANFDAIAAAEGMGIRRDRAVKYVHDAAGTALNFRALGDALCDVRAARPLTAAWKADIEADEQARG